MLYSFLTSSVRSAISCFCTPTNNLNDAVEFTTLILQLFFIVFTREANFKVDSVSSRFELCGEHVATR